MPLSKLGDQPRCARVYRGALGGVVFLLFVAVCHVFQSHSATDRLDAPTPLAATQHNLGSNPPQKPRLLNHERVLELTANNRDFTYLPTSNIMFMTMAKGGTTSTWNWLYRGSTGRDKFNMTECETYVQDVRSHCWGDEAVHVHLLSKEEQWRILTSKETLRVAIQRNPYERLISSFKSKFTCEDEKYGTDLRNRATMVPALRRQAGLPEGEGCMSITQFAEALDSCRLKAGSEGHRLKSLRHMDVHVRPQDFYFDEIDYDMVLDIRELSNVTYLQPVIERLKYRDLVKDGIEHKHASGGDPLMIPEKAASMLHMFAIESRTGASKHLL